MRLLFENWRQYLAERTTDKAFAETVDFLVDTFTDPKNFDWTGEGEEEEYMGPDMAPEDWAKLLGDFEAAGMLKRKPADPADQQSRPLPIRTFTFYQVEPRMDENWDRFVEQHPGAAEQLGLDPNKMFFFMELKVVYGYNPETRKGNKEDFDEKDDTNVAGYFSEDELVINLKANRFNVSEEEYRKLDENTVLKILRGRASVVRVVVEHEFTHLLNYLRAGKYVEGEEDAEPKLVRGSSRAKGIKRHHYQRPEKIQKSIRYANSTEEIQARLIPIFKIVWRAGERDQDEIPKSDVNEIAKLINIEATNFSGNKSLSNIIKLLYQIYELHHPNYLDWTSKSNKKRLTKRFYEFAEELVSK